MDKLKKQLQLSTTVDQQKQEIAQLQQKYKDLAKAYRVLQKENVPASEKAAPSASSAAADESEILQEKFKQAQAQKSRLEAAFQLERNKLIDEKEELEKSLDEALKSLDANSLKYRAHIKDLRSRLSIDATGFEQERQNHQLLIRELQKAITEERQKKEAVEIELSRLKLQVGGLKDSDFTKEARYRDSVVELESLQRKLSASEASLKERSQRLQKAESNLRNLSSEMERQLENERVKAATAEENLRQLTQLHEMRVSSLESKTSELTDTLCSYESLRLQDAALIATLKDKVMKHELEVSIPLRSTEPDTLKDVNSLMNQIIKLKSDLYTINHRADTHIDIDSFLRNQFGAYADHSICEKEALYVRQELDQLKVRFQETGSAKEDNALLEEVSLLKGKADLLRTEIDVLNFEKNRALADLRMTALEHAEAMRNVRLENGQQMAELEAKLQETRERLLKIVSEKEEEVSSMKRLLNAPVALKRRSQSHATAADDIAQSLSQISVANAMTPAGANILHFVEDMSRKDVEISSLKRAKFELELGLRELEAESGHREAMLLEQLHELKSHIRQQDLGETRETANLEYVKNVMLRYLLTSDKQIQAHLFNALSTILCFTPGEVTQVRKKHPYWK